MADKNLSGPIIYDALHAAGARKIGVQTIHSYNQSHFAKVAPDLTVV